MLRCLASDLNATQTLETYGLFLAEWEQFRAANIFVAVSLPLAEATVELLLVNEGKWRRNCRRNVRQYKLLRRQQSKNNSQDSASMSKSNTSNTAQSDMCQRSAIRKRKYFDICLFCQCPQTKQDVLHSFQRLN